MAVKKKVAQEQQNEIKRVGATEDDIRKRAYELYLARNGGPGTEVGDWLRAEAELRPVQLFR